MSNVHCCFVLQCVVYDFGAWQGPNGSIFCILCMFYKCLVKIDVRVCGGLPVFEFCLSYYVLLMMSVNVTVHLFYIGFVYVM